VNIQWYTSRALLAQFGNKLPNGQQTYEYYKNLAERDFEKLRTEKKAANKRKVHIFFFYLLFTLFLNIFST
jgi:hypothetical protein